jgi:hypothetical protein
MVAVAVSVVVVALLRGGRTLVGVLVLMMMMMGVVVMVCRMVLRLVVGGRGGAPETLSGLEFFGLFGRLCFWWGRRRDGGARVWGRVGYGYVYVVCQSALVVDCSR